MSCAAESVGDSQHWDNTALSAILLPFSVPRLFLLTSIQLSDSPRFQSRFVHFPECLCPLGSQRHQLDYYFLLDEEFVVQSPHRSPDVLECDVFLLMTPCAKKHQLVLHDHVFRCQGRELCHIVFRLWLIFLKIAHRTDVCYAYRV